MVCPPVIVPHHMRRGAALPSSDPAAVVFAGQSPYLEAITIKDADVANHLYQNDLPDGLDLGPVEDRADG